MKSSQSYRVSGRFKEILEVLEKAKKSRKNFLWRAHKRQPIFVFIHQINTDENTVEVSLQDSGSAFFKVKDELYLKLDTRDSAFKTKVSSIHDHNSVTVITLEFPAEMVLSEYRSETRHYFHPNDEKKVQIKKNRNYVSSLSERMFSLVVSDVSQSGLSLVLNSIQSDALQVKDRIVLEELGLFHLNPSIPGEVVFKVQMNAGAKIGIHLDKKIPKAIFDRFIIRESFFTEKDEHLCGDLIFRKEVQGLVQSVQKKMNQNKNFLKLFERIDMRFSEHYYLKQHMQLLSEVMCRLGVTLGWVSEETMDKLIYVAYLHDACYFRNPKLAKIKSLKDFKKSKKLLLAGEQTLFLEGPLFASELARLDIDSYPDAPKILLQQKELPDGSGFPHGITHAQFLPLSCLLVACHYFVDYIIENQDWSVNDFLKTHQKILKGPYFQKVFQAMRG